MADGTEARGIVIVGAGQGGAQAAVSLREHGYAGRVRLVGEEPGLPYQRPPLSKGYLLGALDAVALQVRARAFYDEHAIEVVHGRATGIEREACHVSMERGPALAYDHLVLATGARNRPLPVPGADLEGVAYLRTLADAAALRDRLAGSRQVVIIGAGFIGLEFASVAAARGMSVTVLEATSRPMSRALSQPMSEFFRTAHEAAGIRLVFGAIAARIDGHAGHVTAVETVAGEVFAADLVLVGIGVMPNIELAAEAGLPVENGIVVDGALVTADPRISAIGDCAAYPQPFAAGARVRLESVQNAVDHARCVAARLTGGPGAYHAVPWFWSDQVGYKLQIAGLAIPHEQTVLRGDPASGAFSVFCYHGDTLLGVESVNRPADHMIARRLIASSQPLTPAKAADATFDLKAYGMSAVPA